MVEDDSSTSAQRVGSSIATFMLAALGDDTYQQMIERISPVGAILNVTYSAVLAYLYLNSAARLGSPPTRIRESKLTPRPKLN